MASIRPALKLSDQNVPRTIDRYRMDGVDMSFGPSINPAFAHANRRFVPEPADAAPIDLFVSKINRCTRPGYRLFRKTDYNQMLIFVDGACSNNGAESGTPRGGCAVVLGPLKTGLPIMPGLEIDNIHPHTSNRAELRAVILALFLRRWTGEGFKKLVIATDSEYVVEGMASWHKKWIANGWRNARGDPVANRDLWEVLLQKIDEMEFVKGELVQFWRIPREWNEADGYAKMASLVCSSCSDF